MLESECSAAGVEVFLNANITEVTHATHFIVRTATDEFHAPALVVATGGLTIPKMGATDFGYRLARQFKLKIIDPRPALTPLLLNQHDRTRYCDLAGVATEVVASTADQSFREALLVTHQGLSGPAILQISSYWQPGKSLQINLAPANENVFAPLRNAPTRTITAARSSLNQALPTRLATRWLEANPPNGFTNADIDSLENQLHNWTLHPAALAGFDKAEVTLGGIDTTELSSKTTESQKIPGLFFIGEVVDVTGHLGGFNFQWAWSSAHAAAQTL
jgi:predicted Rossmann fold flavoprotein